MDHDTNPLKKAFVAGWPIHHSLSPVLHSHWLARYDIAGSYEALAIEPQNLSSFLATLGEQGYCGGNITIPHKEAALQLCDELSDEARSIGAVNTVWLDNGKLCGTNTDAHGFSGNLDQFAPAWRSRDRALILGAGGAARAIVHALVEAGFDEIAIANRTPERAAELAGAFGKACRAVDWQAIETELGDVGLLVNTTSLGMTGQSALDVDLTGARAGMIVTDIVYSPLVTPLLAQARDRGLLSVDGLGMLLHQAAPGFEQWFGHRPEVDEELRTAVLAALANRDGSA